MSSAVEETSGGSRAVGKSRELLRVDEAAEVLGMSPRHVRRLVQERRVAFHRFGRSIRLEPADIEAYIEASRVEPITESDVWRTLRRVG
jgi:excisionase family DNA binding protein